MRRAWIVIFILVCMMLPGNAVFAVDDPDDYIVTVQEVRMKNTSGEWVTIATPDQAIDIADAAAGAEAAAIGADAAIPSGEYVNFMIVLSATMTVRGTDAATGKVTGNGGTVTITGADANASSTSTWDQPSPPGFSGNLPNTVFGAAGSVVDDVPAVPQQMNFQLNLGAAGGRNDGSVWVYARSDQTPILIDPSTQVQLIFNFDVANTIFYSNPGIGDWMMFLPPSDGTSFSVISGGDELTLNAANMKMEW